MENFSIIPFILVIISVFSALGGIALLIIGLVQNKPKLWIPGSIIFTIAIVTGIVGAVFSLKPFVGKFSHNIDKIIKEQRHHDSLSNILSDSTYNIASAVDSSSSKYVSGFIYDIDRSLIFIKVFPKKELRKKGIHIIKVSKGEKSNITDNVVSIMINFREDFKGNLKLTLFNFEGKEIGNSIAEITQNPGKIEIISFPFSDDVKLSAIDYCTLNIE